MGGVRDAVKLVINCGLGALFVYTLFISYELAYDIRMYAINTYGRVIHEFDPWFNYRATEYLESKVTPLGWYQGLTDFFHWCAVAQRMNTASCTRTARPIGCEP